MNVTRIWSRKEREEFQNAQKKKIYKNSWPLWFPTCHWTWSLSLGLIIKIGTDPSHTPDLYVGDPYRGWELRLSSEILPCTVSSLGEPVFVAFWGEKRVLFSCSLIQCTFTSVTNSRGIWSPRDSTHSPQVNFPQNCKSEYMHKE